MFIRSNYKAFLFRLSNDSFTSCMTLLNIVVCFSSEETAVMPSFPLLQYGDRYSKSDRLSIRLVQQPFSS